VFFPRRRIHSLSLTWERKNLQDSSVFGILLLSDTPKVQNIQANCNSSLIWPVYQSPFRTSLRQYLEIHYSFSLVLSSARHEISFANDRFSTSAKNERDREEMPISSIQFSFMMTNILTCRRKRDFEGLQKAANLMQNRNYYILVYIHPFYRIVFDNGSQS
jgi:hypothetical protein